MTIHHFYHFLSFVILNCSYLYVKLYDILLAIIIITYQMLVLHQTCYIVFLRLSQLFMQGILYFSHFTGENTEAQKIF